MRNVEPLLRLLAGGVAAIAAGWAIRSAFRHHEPGEYDLSIILIRVGFYGFISFGFMTRVLGARWIALQWLGCAVLFGSWIWEGRAHFLSRPALWTATGLA